MATIKDKALNYTNKITQDYAVGDNLYYGQSALINAYVQGYKDCDKNLSESLAELRDCIHILCNLDTNGNKEEFYNEVMKILSPISLKY